MLTAERLRTLLDYNPETGILPWKQDRAENARAGDEAGFIHRDGYRYIRIGRRQYAAHRLAWLHVTGEPLSPILITGTWTEPTTATSPPSCLP